MPIPTPQSVAYSLLEEWLADSSAPLKAAVGERDLLALAAAVAEALATGKVWRALGAMTAERDALLAAAAAVTASHAAEVIEAKRTGRRQAFHDVKQRSEIEVLPVGDAFDAECVREFGLAEPAPAEAEA